MVKKEELLKDRKRENAFMTEIIEIEFSLIERDRTIVV